MIGTDPPCPRCDLLAVRAQQAAEGLQRPVTVRHVRVDSVETAAVGHAVNRQVGTPPQVAEEAGSRWIGSAGTSSVQEQRRLVGDESRAAESLDSALDALLDPCREAAEAVGYLMTPVLVVNGTVVHHGSVPTVERVREWLVSA